MFKGWRVGRLSEVSFVQELNVMMGWIGGLGS